MPVETTLSFSALVDLPVVLFKVYRRSAVGFVRGFDKLRIVEHRSLVLQELRAHGFYTEVCVGGWARVTLRGPQEEFEPKKVILYDPHKVPTLLLRGRVDIMPYSTPEAIRSWAIRGRGPHREEWYLLIELLPLVSAAPKPLTPPRQRPR